MTITSLEHSVVPFWVYIIKTDYSVIMSLSAVSLLKLLLNNISSLV